ncbi:hypothetical protein BHG07_03045 [Brenneria salicis ATCC 15712 = DSM 30166]|nr:hypothetical protein BHG07_03045 [Brenneria salicis ATCC 15712 = DSM 30166]
MSSWANAINALSGFAPAIGTPDELTSGSAAILLQGISDAVPFLLIKLELVDSLISIDSNSLCVGLLPSLLIWESVSLGRATGACPAFASEMVTCFSLVDSSDIFCKRRRPDGPDWIRLSDSTTSFSKLYDE